MKALKTLLIAGMLAASGAQAQVIDFDELAHEDSYSLYQSILADGFQFGSAFGSDALGVWGRTSAYQADVGNAAVFINNGRDTVTMSQVGGGAFNFASIDFADVYNQGTTSDFRFTFNYAAGGSSSADISLDNLAGLQTFAFNQAGVSSVTWQNIGGDGGWGQFDNVNIGLITAFPSQTDVYDVSLAPITAPVPEPETYALMLAGLGMVAWMARRRRPQD